MQPPPKQKFQEQPLQGQSAVVTGSSSGIGRQVALTLASRGADVLIHARRNRAGAEEVAEVISKMGRQAPIVLADLSHQDEREKLIESAWKELDDVNVWVNNAGADVLTGPNAELNYDEKFELVWTTDVQATVHLSRVAGQRMLASSQNSGDRLMGNIGWDQAEKGMAGDSGEMFAASKGAIMCFTRSIAKSLAPQVRVNCLAPGWVKTSWGETASEYWQHRAQQESLLNRWGEPEDIAAACLFLATGGRFINGQIIPINGGNR